MRCRHAARGLAIVVELAIAVSCSGSGTSSDREPSSDAQPPGPNSADSAWATVESAADASLLEAPAHVVVQPGSVAEIAPTHKLHVERVSVRPGDEVEAGAVVVEGTAPELLQAAAALQAASAQAEITSERRERLAELRREGLVEQSRVFELDVALAELQGQRMRAAATLRGAGYSVAAAARLVKDGSAGVAFTSPIAGTVRTVDAVVGQVRDADAGPMVTIVGSGPARIEARLPGPVPPDARFEMIVHGNRVIDLGGAPIATLVVPEDGTTLAWWDPPVDDLGLAPGLRGRVRARVVDHDLLSVPSAALRFEDGGATVLRETNDGRTEVVPVKVVASSGTSSIVSGPLSAGDRVAADVSLVLPPPEVTE